MRQSLILWTTLQILAQKKMLCLQSHNNEIIQSKNLKKIKNNYMAKFILIEPRQVSSSSKPIYIHLIMRLHALELFKACGYGYIKNTGSANSVCSAYSSALKRYAICYDM